MKIKWLGNMFNTVLRFLDQWRDFASSVSVEDVVSEYEGVVLACCKSADWGRDEGCFNTRSKVKPTVRYKKLNLCSLCNTTLELDRDFKICRVIGWARILQATRLLSHSFPTNDCRSQRHYGYIAKIGPLPRI